MNDIVQIKKTTENNLPKLVILSYEGDEQLFEKYHVGKLSFFEAVDSTLKMCWEAKYELDLQYYKVLFGDTIIGYMVISGDFIYSFAIAVKYRTKDILKAWWEKVKFLLGNSFSVGLLSNNKRAIKYMEDRGMKISWVNPENKYANEILLTY